MIARSQAAFRAALGSLLPRFGGRWVAFNGERQIGVGRTQTKLHQRCLALGLRPDEFVVRYVGPATDDDDVVMLTAACSPSS